MFNIITWQRSPRMYFVGVMSTSRFSRKQCSVHLDFQLLCKEFLCYLLFVIRYLHLFTDFTLQYDFHIRRFSYRLTRQVFQWGSCWPIFSFLFTSVLQIMGFVLANLQFSRPFLFRLSQYCLSINLWSLVCAFGIFKFFIENKHVYINLIFNWHDMFPN